MVIWLVAMYFFFKIVVVGSIYKVIALTVIKIHDAVVAKKVVVEEVIKKVNTIVLESKLITSDETTDKMLQLVNRMQSTSYIHDNDVDWVMNALDYYESAEGTNRYTLKKHSTKV